MTDLNFSKGLKKLESAFRIFLSQNTIEVYYEELKHLKDDTWENIIQDIIKEGDKFPLISTFIKKAWQYE